MKKILQPCLLILLATSLCGCPFNSPYNLNEKPEQNIDESLLGNWSAIIEKTLDNNHANRDPVTIDFSKKNKKILLSRVILKRLRLIM